MSSKDLIFSGDSGLRASRLQGALPSGVRPNSLDKKTLLPAVSRFYAHPPPFLTSSAIPRTIVVRVCLSEPPRSSPRVARSALRENRSTMSIFSLCSGHLVYPVCTPPSEKRTLQGTRATCTNAESAPCRHSSVRHAPQSTLVCDAAVFGTVLVKTIHSI